MYFQKSVGAALTTLRISSSVNGRFRVLLPLAAVNRFVALTGFTTANPRPTA